METSPVPPPPFPKIEVEKITQIVKLIRKQFSLTCVWKYILKTILLHNGIKQCMAKIALRRDCVVIQKK